MKLSTVLLSNTSGQGPAITGDQFKGAGYLNIGDGQHTVQVQFTNFTGDFIIEGSLASDPTENDWFAVKLDGISEAQTLVSETSVKYYTFESNLIWVRAKITNQTTGFIEKVLMAF